MILALKMNKYGVLNMMILALKMAKTVEQLKDDMRIKAESGNSESRYDGPSAGQIELHTSLAGWRDSVVNIGVAVRLSVCLSVDLYVDLSVGLSVGLSVCGSVCLWICLSVDLLYCTALCVSAIELTAVTVHR